MSAAHTPGPWIAAVGMTQMCNAGSTVARARPANDATGFWWICADADHGNAEADARLIAAAPKLLAACTEARVWLLGRAGAERQIADLDAAIAAATGEAP